MHTQIRPKSNHIHTNWQIDSCSLHVNRQKRKSRSVGDNFAEIQSISQVTALRESPFTTISEHIWQKLNYSKQNISDNSGLTLFLGSDILRKPCESQPSNQQNRAILSKE
jgi:hypothetical protein